MPHSKKHEKTISFFKEAKYMDQLPETTPLIKAALNLRVGAGFDVYVRCGIMVQKK